MLNTVQYQTWNTDLELVNQVAARWVERARSRPTGGSFALSGGRIAAGLLRATAEESSRRATRWAHWHCFWADERCVPPDHPDSNYRLARENFLAPLDWPESRVHRLRGELEPHQAAVAGETELRSVTGGDRRLDLILLGMGEDGHVASLFPGGEGRASDANRDYLAVQGPKPPLNRVTLTFSAIIRAAEVWVVVAGRDKHQTLQRALGGESALPLGRVLAARKSSQVFYSLGAK